MKAVKYKMFSGCSFTQFANTSFGFEFTIRVFLFWFSHCNTRNGSNGK